MIRKPIQQSLFDIPTFNIAADIKAALNQAVKNSGLSREDVVDKMNAHAERYGVNLVNGNSTKLTLDTLEKWLNPADHTRSIPLKALPLFCAVVKDMSPLDILAKPLGCEVIGPKDRKMLEWARIKLRQKKEGKLLRELEAGCDD